MTGFMTCIGECVACTRRIQFNPDYVPSIRVEEGGSKEPLCETCFQAWNRIHRIAKGLAPEVLHPRAYSPECDA